MNGVRIPRTPSGGSLLAVGIALIPIFYGLAVGAYRKGVVKYETRRRQKQPKG